MEDTINVDIEVDYFWFDNQDILKNNGDAELVDEVILEGNYDAFMEFYQYYNNLGYDNEKQQDKVWFPDKAPIYFQDEYVGDIIITEPTGFNMITYVERIGVDDTIC